MREWKLVSKTELCLCQVTVMSVGTLQEVGLCCFVECFSGVTCRKIFFTLYLEGKQDRLLLAASGFLFQCLMWT